MRQFSLSTIWIWVIAVFALAAVGAVAGSGALLYHKYRNLEGADRKAAALRENLAVQQLELKSQRVRLKTMAERINSLTDRFVKLQDFETRIRIIADLEQTGENGGVFAIGGSDTESLDPSLSLSEKHNSLNREMNERIHTLSSVAALQEDSLRELLDGLEGKRDILVSTPSIHPVKGKCWTTSNFGYRKSPFTGLREFHKGQDMAARHGTPLVAPADGTVTFVGKKGLMGRMMVIDHGHGFITRYGHLDKALKKKGEAVRRGEEIAHIGNTGRSTGPHVHYEVHLNGIPVNPQKYILN
ncbi:MAG: M23 family metallopeptidase [Desulfatibacillaceae bacterium]